MNIKQKYEPKTIDDLVIEDPDTKQRLCQRRSKSRPLGGAKSGRVIRVLASAARA